jgi:hypothetical protein
MKQISSFHPFINRRNTQTLCAVVIATLVLTLGCGKKEAQPSQTSSTATSADNTGPLRLILKISPDHPSMTKPITFSLHITDEQGQPVSDAQVNGGLTMKLMDMGVTKLTFVPKGNGDYEASVKGLDMSGPWNLAVDATQGGKHVKKDLDVTVFD